MTARKTSTRRKTGTRRKKTPPRRSAIGAIDDALKELEKQSPKGMQTLVKDFRKNVRTLEKQIESAQAQREARWERFENEVRRDVAKLLRRLEKSVSAGTSKKTAGRRPAGKKAAARKRASGKGTARKAAPKKGARKRPAAKRKTGTRKKPHR